MKINDVINGFKLVRQETVAEISSEAYMFEHVKSGARLLYLANDDDNKVFSISFRTPPADDTGVPHIIEHSTLCGSRKFPLKEPFVELVKGSLNTFLNAMTFPDKTMYPIASCNDKDFHNLMDVYLDAVFYPAIYESNEILMQEGWHYEIEKPEDPLTYSGVVFNEMKGALSSPDDLLENKIMAALFPENTYSKESGGNPAAIPDLTYEMFKDFHHRYYSPANSYIFLYGDMDIEEQLAFIDSEYLSNFDRVDVDSRINKQPAFTELKDVQGAYPVGKEESKEGKTFLSCNLVMAEAGDSETIEALNILVEALFKTPAAPVRQALIKAGIGKDVDAHFEKSVLQPYLTVSVTGAEAEQAEEFKKVLYAAVKEQVTKGIDQTILEAALNQNEFSMRETDFGRYPKGLIYNINLMDNWLYDQDPLAILRYEDELQSLREKLGTGFYEKLLQEKFLDNKFGAFVTMVPDSELAEKNEKAVEEKLAKVKAAMTEAEIQQVIADTAKLKLKQQTPDSPEALATIPLLKIEDIKKEPRKLKLEERQAGDLKVLYTPAKTQGIAYLNLYFAADTVPADLVPYLFIFEDLLGLVDTTETSYQDMTNKVNLNTGGVAFDLQTITSEGNADEFKPFLKVSAKAFARKLPVLMDILGEILTKTTFADKSRLQELMQKYRSDMEMEMLQSSVQVAISRLNSFTSRNGVYGDIGGLSLYPLVKQLTDDFEAHAEDLQAKLSEVYSLLFGTKHLTVGITTEEKYYDLFAKELQRFADMLKVNAKADGAELVKYDLVPATSQEALLSASQVQYVAKGANLYKAGYEYDGSYRVLDVILKYDYFWTKIRVQGGAYGAMTRFGVDGEMLFVSYRDPRLAETIDVFDGTADYLRNFEASDREMTKYIIGAISSVDTPLTPRLAGAAAQRLYFSGTTYEMRLKRRQQILSASVEGIRKLAEPIDACMKAHNLCVFGNESVIEANKDIFKKLTKVMD